MKGKHLFAQLKVCKQVTHSTTGAVINGFLNKRSLKMNGPWFLGCRSSHHTYIKNFYDEV